MKMKMKRKRKRNKPKQEQRTTAVKKRAASVCAERASGPATNPPTVDTHISTDIHKHTSIHTIHTQGREQHGTCEKYMIVYDNTAAEEDTDSGSRHSRLS